MRLLRLLIRPRTLSQGAWWLPLLIVGAVGALGISLATGFNGALERQAEFKVTRDGPRGVEPASAGGILPARASEVVATAYGPLVVTSFAGEPGTPLPVPGIPSVGAAGEVRASPAVIARLGDDWSGELGAWAGPGPVEPLAASALAHPDELVIVQFLPDVPPEARDAFAPLAVAGPPEPVDGSFAVLGLAVLLFPSVALALGGVRLHLSNRAERYGLLRLLGITPRRLQLLVVAEMLVPLVGGAAIGVAAYQGAMAVLPRFQLAGASYWADDLVLSWPVAAAIVAAVAAVAVAAAYRTVRRAVADPLGTLRSPRRITRAWLAAGVALAGVLLVLAAEAPQAASPWLVTLALLAAAVGLIGVVRLAVAALGGWLLRHSAAQVAGARMGRAPGGALLGATASAVAILLVAFVLGGNFTNRPAAAGDFDVLVDLPGVDDPSPLAAELESMPGVRAVGEIGRLVVTLDGAEGSLYLADCDTLQGTADVSGSCAPGQVYTGGRLEAGEAMAIGSYLPSLPLDGVAPRYPVGGTVDALWMDGDDAVLVPGGPRPAPHHTQLTVDTDGSAEALRAVLDAARRDSGVESATTRFALESGVDEATLVLEPYLAITVAFAGVMAAVALAFSVLILFRQRRHEFSMVRALGATRAQLSTELGLLFAVPLILATTVAALLGLGLAVAYNAAFGAPWRGVDGLGAVLGAVVAVGLLAAAWVMARATRVPAAVPDPDALL